MWESENQDESPLMTTDNFHGIDRLVFALTIRPFPNWGWVLASGVIGILLSLFLWASLPVTAIWLLGVLLGIHLTCEGAALGYLAWQVRQS
jgi:uncharacterized membrane protein HdeD (DUF308 family)